MPGPDGTSGFLDQVLSAAGKVADSIGGKLAGVFLSPGSAFSLLSLLAALLVAVAFLMLRGRRKWRHPKVLARALFPKWLWRNASMRADIGFFLLNILVTGALVGWALVSYSAISDMVSGLLTSSFGASPGLVSSPVLRGAIITLALFLAYDFAYWIDHKLKHSIPALWEFQRVHHTAEILSPLTVYRMHPVDSAIFYNIIAVALGLTQGVALYLMGGPADEATLSGTNILLVVFVFATIHLQHSHIAISFSGIWGKLFFSPAHHQLHHSNDPRHYGSNFGSCLAVWDLMFGTLRQPVRDDRGLEFGAEPEPDGTSPHSATSSLVAPFSRALALLWPFRRPKRPEPKGVAV
jgi:sterol desaturase/sphingolipid hydroxylase (fatty acid hydroxylase superfamily)